MTNLGARYIDGFVRTARKTYRCGGDGAGGGYRKQAVGCTDIRIGDRYLEYVSEAGAYQSGTRHCMACAKAFYKQV